MKENLQAENSYQALGSVELFPRFDSPSTNSTGVWRVRQQENYPQEQTCPSNPEYPIFGPMKQGTPPPKQLVQPLQHSTSSDIWTSHDYRCEMKEGVWSVSRGKNQDPNGPEPGLRKGRKAGEVGNPIESARPKLERENELVSLALFSWWGRNLDSRMRILRPLKQAHNPVRINTWRFQIPSGDWGEFAAHCRSLANAPE